MDFNELNLVPAIVRAVSDVGYQTPTPIQQQAIPPILKGRDLLGCAQTGTGKTAAFAIPILQLLAGRSGQQTRGKRPVRALILTPTRELALQIYESFCDYGKYMPLRCCVIFGGVSQQPQVAALRRGVDILVATPGRLGDLKNQGEVNLENVEIFVLDEADRMLDMGFIHDVKRVIALLPKQKQTLLFSATMPPEISELVSTILVDPVHITVTPPSTTVDAITQSVYLVDKANKRKLLVHLLENRAIATALVFTRTKHGADRVARELVIAGVKAAAIHGDKSQGARQSALAGFKSGSLRVLVATDIAARGIDIDELSHVFNYDLPEVPETYVHRIGRTGRRGLSGIAISFCDYSEKPLLADIEKLIGKRVPVVGGHPFPMEFFEVPPKPERFSRSPREQRGQGGGTRAPGQRPAAGQQRSKAYGEAPRQKPYGDAPRPKQFGDAPRKPYGDSPRPKQFGDSPRPKQFGDSPRPKQFGEQRAKPHADQRRAAAPLPEHGSQLVHKPAHLPATGAPARNGEQRSPNRRGSRPPQRRELPVREEDQPVTRGAYFRKG